jgi:stringent starvation protein B
MGKTRLPPKKDVALALLENSSVYVHLDPRADGVAVPPWFKNQPQLVLQIGLNMPVPIPDLSLDGDGVSCTLSFSRSPQFCSVPWKAIYALVGEDGRGMVWPEDVPPEVAAQTRTVGATDSKPKKKKKSHLRAVAEDAANPTSTAADAEPPSEEPDAIHEPDSGGEQLDPAEASDSPPASKRKLPPYLRVVK